MSFEALDSLSDRLRSLGVITRTMRAQGEEGILLPKALRDCGAEDYDGVLFATLRGPELAYRFYLLFHPQAGDDWLLRRLVGKATPEDLNLCTVNGDQLIQGSPLIVGPERYWHDSPDGLLDSLQRRVESGYQVISSALQPSALLALLFLSQRCTLQD
mgnify:CR=1 FL=1